MGPKKAPPKPDPLVKDAQKSRRQQNLPPPRSPSRRVRKRRSSTLQRSPEQPQRPQQAEQATKPKLLMRGPSITPAGTPKQAPRLSLTVRGPSMVPETPSQSKPRLVLSHPAKPSIPRSPFVWDGRRLGPKELLPERLMKYSLEGLGPVVLSSQPTSSMGPPPRLSESQISSTQQSTQRSTQRSTQQIATDSFSSRLRESMRREASIQREALKSQARQGIDLIDVPDTPSRSQYPESQKETTHAIL